MKCDLILVLDVCVLECDMPTNLIERQFGFSPRACISQYNHVSLMGLVGCILSFVLLAIKEVGIISGMCLWN